MDKKIPAEHETIIEKEIRLTEVSHDNVEFQASECPTAPLATPPDEVRAKTSGAKTIPPIPQNSAPAHNTQHIEIDEDELTIKQRISMVLSNMKRSLLAADSIISLAVVLITMITLGAPVFYVWATAKERISGYNSPIPATMALSLLGANIGEPEFAYTAVVGTTSHDARYKERALSTGIKYLQEHNLINKRNPLGDTLKVFLSQFNSTPEERDKAALRLANVISNEPELHKALAWMHIRKLDFAAAGKEFQLAAQLVPTFNSYSVYSYRVQMAAVSAAVGNWQQVVNDLNGTSTWGSEHYLKIDALCHLRKWDQVEEILKEDHTHRGKLWKGRLLLLRGDVESAKAIAESLSEARSYRYDAPNSGYLLMSEIYQTEAARETNAIQRREKLLAALAELDKLPPYDRPETELQIRKMTLKTLLGSPDLEKKFLEKDRLGSEEEDAIRLAAVYYAARAGYRLMQGDTTGARQELQKALAINPNCAKALEVGVVLANLSHDTMKLSEYREKLKKALEMPRLVVEM